MYEEHPKEPYLELTAARLKAPSDWLFSRNGSRLKPDDLVGRQVPLSKSLAATPKKKAQIKTRWKIPYEPVERYASKIGERVLRGVPMEHQPALLLEESCGLAGRPPDQGGKGEGELGGEERLIEAVERPLETRKMVKRAQASLIRGLKNRKGLKPHDLRCPGVSGQKWC